MMTPFDTALLRHRPDHLCLPSETQRAAGRLETAPRFSLRAMLARIIDSSGRGPAASALPLADTRF